MSETMLEKAALSVAAALMDGPVDKSFSFDDVNGWTQEMSYEIARAVLMAVRELPEDFTRERRAQFYNTEFLDVDFEAVIDTILAQEPGA